MALQSSLLLMYDTVTVDSSGSKTLQLLKKSADDILLYLCEQYREKGFYLRQCHHLLH